MKTKIGIVLGLFLLIANCCTENFLDTTPIGVASDKSFANEKGIDGLLTGAYAYIDGTTGWSRYWEGAVSNWGFGSVTSDDAYYGLSGWLSQLDDMEKYQASVANDFVLGKWIANFDGVSRANDVLKVLYSVDNIPEAIYIQFEAQARFLRAWQHFELKRVFNNIPYITEDPTIDPRKVSNQMDSWTPMEEDLKFAANNLPTKQTQVGRPTKYAAEAVLARVHLFQKDWAAAATLLDDIINNGGYQLMTSYHDNYNIPNRNNKESIFEIQYVVHDAADPANGGLGDNITFPQNTDIGGCCGVYFGSQDLVNAFKVDANGLPLFDTYNKTDLANDFKLGSAEYFVQDTVTPVDPRLDWTVGRRGIPYLDWGINRGSDWIRDPITGGRYLAKKGMYYKSEKGKNTAQVGWSVSTNNNNYRAYRYAHVLLWRAECYVEMGELDKARQLVNQIRARAGNVVVMGRSRTFNQPASAYGNSIVDYSVPAANYKVGLYTSFPTEAYAREAVHWELRLEFGMEGHRFYDLVRWGNAAAILNAYVANDLRVRTYLAGVVFLAGKNEYMPIPQIQIDLEGSDILKQNPGY